MDVYQELIMRRAQSLGYAWAAEDIGRVPTVNGATAFSDAYVAAFGAFSSDGYGVGVMPSVATAYHAWQASNGTTVYHELAYARQTQGDDDWFEVGDADAGTLRD